MEHKAKNALIIGIRDQESICTEIATELKRSGYTLYATYQDETTVEGVRSVADDLGIKKLYPYDARRDEDLKRFTGTIKEEGVGIDVLVHGISYSTAKGAKLGHDLTDLSWEEFTDAIRVGAFSLAEITGHLLETFNEEASILAVSMHWSKVAVPGYNVVCATKACLESIIRGLAESLGEEKRIRVNGISPGFVSTHSLSKIGNSLELLEQARSVSPLGTTVRKEDIASLAVSVLENKSITAMILPVDAGVEIMA